jgi:hypothetical protein
MSKATLLLCLFLAMSVLAFSQPDSAQAVQVYQSLQIKSLDVNVINKNVQLIWTVNTNEEVRSFEVERADDGQEYKKIGGKLSLSQAGKESYEFVDALPKRNIPLSYRVKILGKDGSTVYSGLRTVKVDNEELKCKLKQNPVRQVIELEVVAPGKTDLQATVYTNYGQKVASETARLTMGVNNFSISSQSLLPGLHRLVLETGSERKVISFVKE